MQGGRLESYGEERQHRAYDGADRPNRFFYRGHWMTPSRFGFRYMRSNRSIIGFRPRFSSSFNACLLRRCWMYSRQAGMLPTNTAPTLASWTKHLTGVSVLISNCSSAFKSSMYGMSKSYHTQYPKSRKISLPLLFPVRRVTVALSPDRSSSTTPANSLITLVSTFRIAPKVRSSDVAG